MQRDELSTSQSGRVVNFPICTATSSGAGTCQERVDAKGLTGKGNRPDLRQLTAEVDRLEQHMNALVEASKAVPGAQMYLTVHVRKATGYVFLRWREVGGTKRHLSWQEVRATYMGYSERLRTWYMQICGQAMDANQAHVQLRRDIRKLKKRMEATGSHIYARPIPQ